MTNCQDAWLLLRLNSLRIIACVGLAVILPGSSALHAECLSVRESLAQRLARTQLVFVGEVVTIETVLQLESFRYRITFRVDEAFHGLGTGEQVVDFRPTAEDFNFEVSQRVLVYAHPATGSAEAYSTQCTATRIVASDDSEVRELRELTQK